MNWRRGILLAGINLAIVIPTLVREETRFWRYTGTDVSSRPLGVHVETVILQEEVAMDLDPCHWYDIGSSRLNEVVGLANLPTAILTGWHDSCLTRTALGRGLRRTAGARNHATEIADCVSLAALVLIQWMLVGGLPLVQPRRWWLEPGAFITTAGVISAPIALIPAINEFARIPALLAGLGWLWYFALLLWKPVHLAWQSTLQGLRRLSN